MSHTLKLNNTHKRHPEHCATCGRRLPRRAYRVRCAVCVKREQGKVCEFCNRAAVISDSSSLWCGLHYWQATGDASFLHGKAGAA